MNFGFLLDRKHQKEARSLYIEMCQSVGNPVLILAAVTKIREAAVDQAHFMENLRKLHEEQVKK